MNRNVKLGAVGAVVVLAIILYLQMKPTKKDVYVAPAGTVYFTGPMLSKSGTYATEDGTRVMGPSNTKHAVTTTANKE